MPKNLQEIFQNRTIGYQEWANDWTWRGPGYDDGWERPSIEELEDIRDALTAWLRGQYG